MIKDRYARLKIRNKDRQRGQKAESLMLMGGTERWWADGLIKAMSWKADGK